MDLGRQAAASSRDTWSFQRSDTSLDSHWLHARGISVFLVPRDNYSWSRRGRSRGRELRLLWRIALKDSALARWRSSRARWTRAGTSFAPHPSCACRCGSSGCMNSKRPRWSAVLIWARLRWSLARRSCCLEWISEPAWRKFACECSADSARKCSSRCCRCRRFPTRCSASADCHSLPFDYHYYCLHHSIWLHCLSCCSSRADCPFSAQPCYVYFIYLVFYYSIIRRASFLFTGCVWSWFSCQEVLLVIMAVCRL